MAFNPANSPEKLETLLDWLNPDRERASSRYFFIRASLIKVFESRRCQDADVLAEQTIDRVMERIDLVAPSFKGDPTVYFYGVAKNVIHEYFRYRQIHVELSEAADEPFIETDPDLELRSRCMDKCLAELEQDDAELIRTYYSFQPHEKVSTRHAIAREKDLKIANLRIRVFRIRAKLRECIEKCCENS